MTNEDKAEQFFIDSGILYEGQDDIHKLAAFIKELLAEQREACGEDVYALLMLQSNSPHWPELAKNACINAVEKSYEDK